MCCYHSSIILLLGPLAEFTIHMLYGSFFFLNEYESYCIRILPFMKSFVNYNLPLKKYYILSFVEVQFPSWFSKADIKSAILHMQYHILFFSFEKKKIWRGGRLVRWREISPFPAAKTPHRERIFSEGALEFLCE